MTINITKHINALIRVLGYVAYKKMYGIKDVPSIKTDVFLSDKDNDWNLLALSATTHYNTISTITIKENQPINLTERNNSWNQLAINRKKALLNHTSFY